MKMSNKDLKNTKKNQNNLCLVNKQIKLLRRHRYIASASNIHSDMNMCLILSISYWIKHLDLLKDSQHINCHRWGSSKYIWSSQLFPLINHFSWTCRRFFFVPMTFNKAFPRVKDTPKIEERHGILCIIWSRFPTIIRHR